jgi:hypothetical protein
MKLVPFGEAFFVYTIGVFQKHVAVILECPVIPGLTPVAKLSEEGCRCSTTVDDDLLNFFVPETFEAVYPFQFRIGRRCESDADWRHGTVGCGSRGKVRCD